MNAFKICPLSITPIKFLNKNDIAIRAIRASRVQDLKKIDELTNKATKASSDTERQLFLKQARHLRRISSPEGLT